MEFGGGPWVNKGKTHGIFSMDFERDFSEGFHGYQGVMKDLCSLSGFRTMILDGRYW